jgi:insulysin
LIQDKNAQKGYAALNVGVGCMADPQEFQGLAHFCEHMLFMGSAKYPGIDEFSDDVAKSGGYDNAYTSPWSTNFTFQCATKDFYQILDKFSQFFVSPLFSETALSKEMHAVNSEADGNLNNDGPRNWHMWGVLSNKDSWINK